MPDEAPVTVAQAAGQLGLSAYAAGEAIDSAITGAVVSDLLSYVMANGKRGNVWVTIQTHSNIIAVAALAGLSAIVIAGGFEPADDTVARAEEEGILVFASAETAYTVAGKLWEIGVR